MAEQNKYNLRYKTNNEPDLEQIYEETRTNDTFDQTPESLQNQSPLAGFESPVQTPKFMVTKSEVRNYFNIEQFLRSKFKELEKSNEEKFRQIQRTNKEIKLQITYNR